MIVIMTECSVTPMNFEKSINLNGAAALFIITRTCQGFASWQQHKRLLDVYNYNRDTLYWHVTLLLFDFAYKDSSSYLLRGLTHGANGRCKNIRGLWF
jgi:hypothetical protein